MPNTPEMLRNKTNQFCLVYTKKVGELVNGLLKGFHYEEKRYTAVVYGENWR